MKNVRYLELDSLRGIAAVSVVIFHTQNYWFEKAYSVFNWAYLCVDLFFILSGIVLAHTYEKKIASGELNFKQFMLARVSRMGPLNWAALIFLLLANLFIFHFGQSQQHIITWDDSAYGFILSALFLQNSGIYPLQTWNPAAWSISAEMCVNIIWFWVVCRQRASSVVIAVAVFFALLLLYLGYGVQHSKTIGITYDTLYPLVSGGLMRCIAGFGLGVLLQRHVLRGKRQVNVFNPLIANVGAALVLLFIVASVLKHEDPNWGGIDYLTVALVFPALILFSLARGSLLGAFLRLKPLVWLGERSYSIYIVHMPMMFCLPSFLALTKLPASYPVLGVFFTASVIFVSALSYRFLEEPARKQLRKQFQTTPVAGLQAKVE
ncbi:acyltransferase [Paraburkholderia bonniea]|uniref:acyltransferase family protein n=1 Tax=Paraburkholderia bonniea TaxID=2152891 RepID=UPI001580A5E6|nr:acyltransferase [Paraburkholderia bonniea]WJF89039.1 acyltransferase [Paraburkholderia bonniea]WJF92355.1 acyltransferase [Paraburkholderia bonniea]